MSSKRAIRRRTCGQKVRHRGVAAAYAHIRALDRAGNGGGLQVYHCPFCRGWHIGHSARVPR